MALFASEKTTEQHQNIGTLGTINRILACGYAASIYASIFFGVTYPDYFYGIMMIPVILWICCLLFQIKFSRSMDRFALFDAVILWKYMMIPFFMIGGCIVVIAIFFSFIPVPFMIIMGPALAATLMVLGWIYMVSGLVFFVPYFLKSGKEYPEMKLLYLAALICQFVLSLDVIACMILTYKEKRWAKVTTSLLMIVVITILVGIGWIVVAIVGR